MENQYKLETDEKDKKKEYWYKTDIHIMTFLKTYNTWVYICLFNFISPSLSNAKYKALTKFTRGKK